MPICPFCKEEVKDGAIKCKYCQSFLLPPQPPPAASVDSSGSGSDRVTYILDKDLIRFAKFAGSVIAIIIALGLLLFGVDLKALQADEKKSQEEIKGVKSSLVESQKDLVLQQQFFHRQQDSFLISSSAEKRTIDSLKITFQSDIRSAFLAIGLSKTKSEELLRQTQIAAHQALGDAATIHTLATQAAPNYFEKPSHVDSSTGSRTQPTNLLTIGQSIADNSGTITTIGLFVKNSNGDRFIITSSNSLNDEKEQPYYNLSADQSKGELIGSVYPDIRLQRTGLKLIKLNPSIRVSNEISGQGVIEHIRMITSRDILEGSAVRLFTSNSGIITGTLRSFDMTAKIAFQEGEESISHLIAANLAIDAGAGGSLLIDKDKNGLGILVAGSDILSYIYPLADILHTMNLQLLH